MTTDLFNQQTTANQDQTQGNPNQPSNSDQSLLNELVGPGKKFSSVEDLAKGKKTSDEFITRLQTEMQGLREELNRRTSAEEIIAQVRAELRQSQSEDNQTGGLDEATVAKIVQSQLSEAQQQAITATNMETVRQAMVAQFQSEEAAKQAIYAKAQELGVSVDYLRTNAATAPKAFLTLMGVSTQGSQQNAAKTSPASSNDFIKSTQNTEALPKGNDAKQVKEYYDNLRRTEPSKYWAPSTQKEIWKLMNEGKYPIE